MTVFVSLQAPGNADVFGAHVATGLLIGPDLVVVPTLPRRVLAQHDAFEALLVPPAGPAQRLPVSHVLVYPAGSIDGQPDPDRQSDPDDGLVALVVRLGRPTALPVVQAPLTRAGSVLDTLRALLPDPDRTDSVLESTQSDPEIPYSPEPHPLSGLSPVPLAEPLSGTHAVEEFPDSPDLCDWVPWC